MSLNELNENETAIITKIDCDEALKNRFYSFGVVKGAKVFLEQVTLAKKTMEIRINQTKIALRFSEAQKIEVSREC